MILPNFDQIVWIAIGISTISGIAGKIGHEFGKRRRKNDTTICEPEKCKIDKCADHVHVIILLEQMEKKIDNFAKIYVEMGKDLRDFIDKRIDKILDKVNSDTEKIYSIAGELKARKNIELVEAVKKQGISGLIIDDDTKS